MPAQEEDIDVLRGVATVNYFADDLDAARRWYTDLLGIEPYFVRPEEGPPGYVEFRIGDFQAELGIISNQWMPRPQVPAAGSVVYWAVDDVEASVARLLSLGCSELDPITPRESGFVTASVVDPFGNIVGVMYNPHYLSIVESAGRSTG